MTQVIAVATRDYILFAADRRVSLQNSVHEDDRCKLISLCNACIIGYAGLAVIDELPTQIWIANKLVDQRCRTAFQAGVILTDQAAISVSRAPIGFRELHFLFGTWAPIKGSDDLTPLLVHLSNKISINGEPLETPGSRFYATIKNLEQHDKCMYKSIGFSIHTNRRAAFENNIHKLAKRKITPNEMLRLLRNEIVATSESEKIKVNGKILVGCIPKAALKTNRNYMLASTPNTDTSTYSLFDPIRNMEYQEAPIMVCGRNAVEHWGEEAGDSITSSFKIIRMDQD